MEIRHRERTSCLEETQKSQRVDVLNCAVLEDFKSKWKGLVLSLNLKTRQDPTLETESVSQE